MRALLVVGIAFVGLALAEPGRSCSIPAPLYPTEPRAVVAEADAAFTGTLIDVRPKNPAVHVLPAPTIFTFAVEEWVKGGDLGDRFEATSIPVGLGCGGLDATIGRSGSYVISRVDGEWGPWGIAPIGPEILRRGLLPWPRPTRAGRPAFIAGGHFGLVRSASLDSRGRTLAYGFGRGAVTALSVCPGRRVAAELVRLGETVRFALRDLPSMRVLSETELRVAGFGETVVCRSRTGSDALVSVAIYQRAQPETQLLRITSVGTRIVETAPRLALAVHGTRVFISLSDGRLVVRDIASGSRRVLINTSLPLSGMSINPDGRFVAGFTGDTLVVTDLVEHTTQQRPWQGYLGRTRWIARTTLAAWSRGRGELELLDQNLRTLHPPGVWRAHTTAATSTGVFGVDWSGRFLTERNGRTVPLGDVFSAAVSVLEPI